ncbi:Tex family protein [Peptostreptococcus anaerobius]|uniref:Tex family protein n=1 Tax=Peptostreptococcus anaerobius TaxID=1261 RepID=UPI002331126C|nr:Tex family protein [Peptostreptococcus anaerobius]MDB8850187.1 Tex family protein [Peptostreptococcus anaerobius]MDB8853889.1 Tex family protein [Peptostreptococcus anaerobius]MDB8855750.1 Tex family protein [Peptostreptococcus anaerobius]
MNIVDILVSELGLRKNQVVSAIDLIDQGNTIPFIARYRKDVTGEMTDIQLRDLNHRLEYLRNLDARKEDIKRLIEEQGKLTEDIEKSLEKAMTLQEAEDIYAPYKQKKRTRATVARERGLENLANMILLSKNINLEKEAQAFVNKEKDVEDIDTAIAGAQDIIAEIMSDDAQIRKMIREEALKRGLLISKAKGEEDSVYRIYYDYSEPVRDVLPHRILAINRGEKEGFLSVKVSLDDENMIERVKSAYLSLQNEGNDGIILEIAQDAYKRLIFPSIEREIRNHLTDLGQERAIQVFGKNLNGLLLQPPIKDVSVMGFDPAYRTGCKIAVVDKNGKLVDYTTIYPTKPHNKVEEAKKTLKKMIDKHKVDIISIGNGTASRESEMFVSDMLKEIDRPVSYVIVNEAGASVYSASELANEEHPDINVSIRGAISIARRLQDPMAELVKIDPKSIGVGQYQHDVNEKRLNEVLDGVVEDSVNKIGVDLNSASYSLLEHVSGISKSIAKNIVAYRDENGEFENREDLKKVKRLGPAAFKQAAGFIRITNAKNPLDNTGVHPESYKACMNILDLLGYSLDDISSNGLGDIDKRLKSYGLVKLCQDSGLGEATLKDIIEEIKKPGRDIRDSGVKPVLRKDVMSLEDLEEDMELTGTVRNVVDFGAFVDIGIKNDGLVHISQISNKRVKNPSDLLTVGDIVKVKVIGIDKERGKVSLSMKNVKQ